MFPTLIELPWFQCPLEAAGSRRQCFADDFSQSANHGLHLRRCHAKGCFPGRFRTAAVLLEGLADRRNTACIK